MNESFQVKNKEVEERLHELGQYLKGRMPEGFGFTLLMSDFGKGGTTFYISSIERDGALESMKEFLVKQGTIPFDGGAVSPITREELGLPAEPVEIPIQNVHEAGIALVRMCIIAGADEGVVRSHNLTIDGIKRGDWEILIKRVL